MGKVIAVANQKGGIGKTTTGLNTADALIHCNYHVLYIDCDAQCNSSSSYGAVIEDQETLSDLMTGVRTARECIQHTEFGDIIAGDSNLPGVEVSLMNKPGGFTKLKKAIKEIRDDYDFIIIDTPPNLGTMMLNALSAADGVIIPVKADKYSIDGLNLLLNTISDVKENTNENLEIYGVLLTSYDSRTSLGTSMWEQLPAIGKANGFHVFRHPIRTCQAIVDAQAEGTSLFEKAPSSNGAIDYAEMVHELLTEVIR